MKLRNRMKCVLRDFKQEDYKPDLNAVESPTITATDASTSDPTIKQEDTKEHKLLLQQNGESATEDYYYQCDMCEQMMTDLKSVLKHRISIHNISPRRLKKDINVEPDIHDPNFYCKSCEKCYSSRKLFKLHLKYAHYLVLKPLPKQKAPHPDVLPDPDDPNLYCRACDYTYSKKKKYRAHCRYAHGMKLAESSSGSTIDTYCQACDKRLASIGSYRRHIFFAHKTSSRTIQQKRNEIVPDVNDPNFYCRSCEKSLANRYSFKKHLMAVHSIFQSAPRKKSRLEPNIDDPKNYCRVCRRSYSSRGRYREHLRLVHQMTLPAMKNSTDLPDPYNLGYYCSVCKKAFASFCFYRQHCRRTHFMVLRHFAIKDPKATIDINNPEHYCSQCKHTFRTRLVFKRHLGKIHLI